MGVLEQAKERVAAWLNLGAVYDVSMKKPGAHNPPEIPLEDFSIRAVNGRSYLTVRNAKSVAQYIIFPGNGEKDKWKCAARGQLIQAVEKMYSHGWFDVSPILSAISTFKLQTPPSVQMALEDLRHIHCVHFDKLTKEVYESIPRHLTHIFTEGRIPAEAVERVEDLEVLRENIPNLDALTLILQDALQELESAGGDEKVVQALRARQAKALGQIPEA